jgi:tRNA-dihydrouridine synthase B
MAGITTGAYRRRMKTHGVGLTVTEMVSAYGLMYGSGRTREYLVFREEERPLAVQLFADHPEVMAEGVRAALKADPRPDLIDLNMGCPVRKVMKTGAGAALMGKPELAARVARAAVEVCSAAGVPVTAKIRSGLVPEDPTAVDVARRLEAAGVAAVAIHPRAASQLYRGHADHRVTAAVVEAVGVPVLASGDIDSVSAGRRVVTVTGAAALMVARGVLGRPRLVGGLLAGTEPPLSDIRDAVDELRALLADAAGDMGDYRAVRWLRKLVSWYLRPVGITGPEVGALMALGERGTLDRALAALAFSSAREQPK